MAERAAYHSAQFTTEGRPAQTQILADLFIFRTSIELSVNELKFIFLTRTSSEFSRCCLLMR